VVNALTEHEHPSQAVADLATMKEEFGSLAGRHILYIGEGNSTAVSLAHACLLTEGLRLTILSPPGYGLPVQARHGLEALGRPDGVVQDEHAIDKIDLAADVIYTSRWQQMGVAKANPGWLAEFQPYRLGRSMVDRFGHTDTIVMHDLPAVRGQEITDEVLDGPASRAFRQAFHKMTAAMAVLEWCVGTGPAAVS